jgi:hypothetical protein
MKILWIGLVLLLPAIWHPALSDDAPAKRSAKEALQVFNDLIGTWKGTGEPKGPLADKGATFWVEKVSWEWQFKGKDAWLKVAFDKSRNFTGGELRYLPDKDEYQLTLRTPAKETVTYTGTIRNRVVLFEREAKDKTTQRLSVTLLHPNRFLYTYSERPAGKAVFAAHYRVGCTKEGEAFAAGDGRPECIVSGGLGTIAVSYQGQTYYVCCGGCRDEFRENPEKYVREYQEKKKKKK